MRRREFLAAGAGSASLAGLTGCLGVLETRRVSGEPPLVQDRPDAIYYPTHVEGMKMAGMASDGAYSCALTYSYPHRFWLVTGTRSEKVSVKPADSLHVMPVVWHTETGIVPPDVNPSLEIRRGGERVTSLRPWAMVSQPMGFHFGDNVQLPAEDAYEVSVSVGEGSARRTGALADAGSASFEFSLPYSQSKLEEIPYRDIHKQGKRGAVALRSMENLPTTQLPKPGDVPGTVRGAGRTGDAVFAVSTFADATRFGGSGDESYLAVSARTRYNRVPLPLMSLSATLMRGSEPVYDDILRATIDPDLGYHYGAVVPSAKTGDALTITVDAPPQVARHEGYETAFFGLEPLELTL